MFCSVSKTVVGRKVHRGFESLPLRFPGRRWDDRPRTVSRLLAYTGPSEGHLYPIVPTLEELVRRAHHVAVVTLPGEVAHLRGMGIEATAADPRIGARAADDWRARTAIGALRRRVRQFADRAPLEIEDLESAIAAQQPDALLIDPTAWGAATAAEASGLPFALLAHSAFPLASADAPPFGLGLRPRGDRLGRARDRLAERAVLRPLERFVLPELNALRASRGLGPLRDATDFARRPDRLLYYTAEPFEYPRSDWPPSVRLVGPGLWEPPTAEPEWLAELRDPLLLVTCSTEFQDDGRIVDAAVAAFAGDDRGVVMTTGGVERAAGDARNVRIERFVPHTPILRRASCLVCHGGMGVTQKALAHGVPVCVIPFGRDQPEVAQRVRVADAGVSVSPRRLDGPRLRRAVEQAATKRSGALRIAAAFAAIDGPKVAADAIEELLP